MSGFPMPAAWDWRKLDHQTTAHDELILALNRKLTELSQIGVQYTAFGPYYPIVTGELGVTDVRYPFGNLKRYGAVGDGVANDSPPAQAWMLALAIADAPTRVGVAPAGRYHFASEVNGVSDIQIWASGATFCSDVTTAPERIRSLFFLNTCTNVSFYGAKFDLGQPVLPTYSITDDPTYYNQAVFATNSADLAFVACRLTNLYTQGFFFYVCSGKLHLFGNKHTSPVQAQKRLMQHINVATSSAAVVVDSCIFDNAAPPSADYGVCAFLGSGTTGSITFINNYLNYCGRNTAGGHQLGSFSCYGDNVRATVRGCIMENNLQQVIRLSNTFHADVEGNYLTMASVAGASDAMIEIESTSVNYPTVGNGIKVHRNWCQDDYSTSRVGVWAAGYDYGTPLKDISIDDNDFVHMQYAVKLGGPYQTVSVVNNKIRGRNGGAIHYGSDAAGTPGTVYGTQAASRCTNLRICGNTWDLDNNGAVPCTVDFTNAHAYTGTIGDVEFSENAALMAGGALAQFFAYRGIAGQGRLTVRNNKPDTYTYAFDIANVAELTLEGNKPRNIAPANFLLAGVGIAVTNRSKNRLAWNPASPYSGVAVMVAGTILVASTEVVAGDLLHLTNVLAGGVVGALSLGAIVPGVSFVINSTSAADTSTVLYEFAH